MYNTHNYFGTDGILSVSDPDGLATDVFTSYFGEDGVVGRVVNVSLHVSTEMHAFHEIGSRAPKELRAGNIAIGGSIERAYINGALLRLMLGQYAEGEEAASFRIPTFNLKLILDNLMPAGDEGNSILTVYGVMFDTWQLNLPEDDFVLERLTFQAKRVSVADSEVSG